MLIGARVELAPAAVTEHVSVAAAGRGQTAAAAMSTPATTLLAAPLAAHPPGKAIP